MQKFKKSFISLFILILVVGISFCKDPFTAKDMHAMFRPGEYIISPDKKYVIYAVSKWDPETGNKTKNIQYKEISSSSEPIDVTKKVIGQSDSNPYMSSSFPNYLLFSRSGKIMYIDFPPKEESVEKELSNYPISIIDFKVQKNTLVFTASVFFNCTTLNCTKELNDIEDSRTYKVYSQAEMFHWDEWLTEGKGTHIFSQKINYKEGEGLSLEGEPKDLTAKMAINAPPMDCASESYDISNNGKLVAFTGLPRDKNEAFSLIKSEFSFII